MKKTYWILIFVVITNFYSQIMFAELAEGIQLSSFNINHISTTLFQVLTEPIFWLAFGFFGISALLWIIGLKKIALSKAFSIISLNYILIFIYSITILKEDITIIRVASCLFIVGGVLLIAQNELIMMSFRKENKG